MTGRILRIELRRSAEEGRVDRAYRRLVGLPADEQRRVMAAARAAGLECRSEVLEAIVLDGEHP